MNKEKLLYYTTLGCHLCDQAREIYQITLNPEFFEIKEVDIADSDELIALYGTRIPVILREDTQQTLGWPFTAADLIRFLS